VEDVWLRQERGARDRFARFASTAFHLSTDEAGMEAATRPMTLRRSLLVLVLGLLLLADLGTPAVGRAAKRQATCRVSARRHSTRRVRARKRCRRFRKRILAGIERTSSLSVASSSNGSPSGLGSSSSSTSGSSSSTSGSSSSTLTPPPSTPWIYWGATIGSQFTGLEPPWDWNAVTDFQNTDAGGKAISVLSWGSPFYSATNCTGYCSFTTSLYQSVRDHGVIPSISWQSTSSTGESGYTDAQIASGSQDAYITQWAQAAKAWGHPFFLRFDWEMNTTAFPWVVGQNGNTAQNYVAMWRHVHDIFTGVGATNATWVWCPNIDYQGSFQPASVLYPGDAYVDWTCLDGYNWDNPWTRFHDIFLSSYNTITGSIAPSKPMLIGETASTETGGSKAQWITDMLGDFGSFPKVHGFLWYDTSTAGPGGFTDWPIESSGSSKTAFASGINQGSTYVGNNYANLNTNPIPPPA
jgi:hypothetical protein